MYIPPSFAETDLNRLHDFIDRNGFALLTSNSDEGLIATHLPMLLDPTRGRFGTLQGHFAKPNEHSLQWDREALAVFSGPHAYISPTWYETPDTVPTWNYVAVHAVGIMKHVDDPQVLNSMLQVLVSKYESGRPVPWQFDPQTTVHQKLMQGIVGFEIEITRIEGKWKLNQNHPPERRRKVIAALLAEGGAEQSEMARLIEETLDDGRS